MSLGANPTHAKTGETVALSIIRRPGISYKISNNTGQPGDPWDVADGQTYWDGWHVYVGYPGKQEFTLIASDNKTASCFVTINPPDGAADTAETTNTDASGPPASDDSTSVDASAVAGADAEASGSTNASASADPDTQKLVDIGGTLTALGDKVAGKPYMMSSALGACIGDTVDLSWGNIPDGTTLKLNNGQETWDVSGAGCTGCHVVMDPQVYTLSDGDGTILATRSVTVQPAESTLQKVEDKGDQAETWVKGEVQKGADWGEGEVEKGEAWGKGAIQTLGGWISKAASYAGAGDVVEGSTSVVQGFVGWTDARPTPATDVRIVPGRILHLKWNGDAQRWSKLQIDSPLGSVQLSQGYGPDGTYGPDGNYLATYDLLVRGDQQFYDSNPSFVVTLSGTDSEDNSGSAQVKVDVVVADPKRLAVIEQSIVQIGNWKDRAYSQIEAHRDWVAKNTILYLTDTSKSTDNPESLVSGFVGSVIQTEISNLAGSLADDIGEGSAAVVCAAIGSEVPVIGTVVGFLVGMMFNDILDSAFGEASGLAEQLHQNAKMDVKKLKLFASATKRSYKTTSQICDNLTDELNDPATSDDRFSLIVAATQDVDFIGGKQPSDESMYMSMLRTWVLQHALTPTKCTAAADQSQWELAATRCFPTPGGGFRLPFNLDDSGSPDAYIYQLRIHWEMVGLPGDGYCDQIIASIKQHDPLINPGGESSGAGGPVYRGDKLFFKFDRSMTDFSAFGKYASQKWEGLVKHLSTSISQVVCNVNVRDPLIEGGEEGLLESVDYGITDQIDGNQGGETVWVTFTLE